MDFIRNALRRTPTLYCLSMLPHYTPFHRRNSAECRCLDGIAKQRRMLSQNIEGICVFSDGCVHVCERACDVDANQNDEIGNQKEAQESCFFAWRCGFYVFLILSVGFSRRNIDSIGYLLQTWIKYASANESLVAARLFTKYHRFHSQHHAPPVDGFNGERVREIERTNIFIHHSIEFVLH